MKIQAQLDHSKILANQGCPVHLALELTAPFAEAGERRPMAFCAILDRSGSMAGRPLAHAKAACEGIIRNLRSSDQFALVTFDDIAEVVLPMATVRDKARAIEAVRRIQERGCTNSRNTKPMKGCGSTSWTPTAKCTPNNKLELIFHA